MITTRTRSYEYFFALRSYSTLKIKEFDWLGKVTRHLEETKRSVTTLLQIFFIRSGPSHQLTVVDVETDLASLAKVRRRTLLAAEASCQHVAAAGSRAVEDLDQAVAGQSFIREAAAATTLPGKS